MVFAKSGKVAWTPAAKTISVFHKTRTARSFQNNTIPHTLFRSIPIVQENAHSRRFCQLKGLFLFALQGFTLFRSPPNAFLVFRVTCQRLINVTITVSQPNFSANFICLFLSHIILLPSVNAWSRSSSSDASSAVSIFSNTLRLNSYCVQFRLYLKSGTGERSRFRLMRCPVAFTSSSRLFSRRSVALLNASSSFAQLGTLSRFSFVRDPPSERLLGVEYSSWLFEGERDRLLVLWSDSFSRRPASPGLALWASNRRSAVDFLLAIANNVHSANFMQITSNKRHCQKKCNCYDVQKTKKYWSHIPCDHIR